MDVTPPLVSVIIPTRNRVRLITRAINSVLDQTYRQLECIVVDDASTDVTRQNVRSIQDDRLVYLCHETNRGASAARNTGIKASKGKYIAFLDDDDEWFPKKLQKQVPLIQSLPDKVGMVYCWMDYFDERGKLIKKHHPKLKGYVFPHVLDAQRLGGCPTLLVRREVIEKVGDFDNSLPRGNDGDFIRRVCRDYQVDYVPEVLVKVHVGHERLTSDWTTDGSWYAIKSQEIKLTKFMKDLGKYPKQEANILASIGYYYSLLFDFKNCVCFFSKAVRRCATSRKVYAYMLRSVKHFMTIKNFGK